MRPMLVCVNILTFVATLAILPGCGSKEAVTFNDNLVRSLQRLSSAGQNFGESIKPVLQGQNPNVQEVRRTQKEAADVLASVKADMKTWSIPPRESAQNLYQSFANVMTIQEEAIGHFGEIVKICEDPKKSNQMRADQISQTIRKFEDHEKVAIMDLQAKQKVFAKDHNIKLIVK